MTCPLCNQELLPKEIDLSETFNCPHCHKLLRVKRNFTIRALRLTLITTLLAYLLTKIPHGPSTAALGSQALVVASHSRLAVPVFGPVLLAAAVIVGLIDGLVIRLLPAKIESADRGTLTLS